MVSPSPHRSYNALRTGDPKISAANFALSLLICSPFYNPLHHLRIDAPITLFTAHLVPHTQKVHPSAIRPETHDIADLLEPLFNGTSGWQNIFGATFTRYFRGYAIFVVFFEIYEEIRIFEHPPRRLRTPFPDTGEQYWWDYKGPTCINYTDDTAFSTRFSPSIRLEYTYKNFEKPQYKWGRDPFYPKLLTAFALFFSPFFEPVYGR